MTPISHFRKLLKSVTFYVAQFTDLSTKNLV